MINPDPNRYEEPATHRWGSYPEVGSPAIRQEIGAALRKARLEQEVSLELIHSITKINPRFLEAIEQGRWNFLPPTYVKAFIKAYSEALQHPIDNLYKRLDEIFASSVMSSALARTPMEKIAPDEEEIFQGGKFVQWVGKHRGAIFWSGAVLIGIISVIFFITRPVEIPTSSITPTPVTQERTLGAPGQGVSPTLQGSSPSQSTVMSLVFTCQDTVRITVSYRDSVYYSAFHQPGSVARVSVPAPARINLSNTPAVSLVVNNQALPLPPSSPINFSFQLDPKGITDQP